MFPVLFQIGGVSVYAYGVFVVLSLFAGAGALAAMARRLGLPAGLTLAAGSVAPVATYLGAKLGWVLLNWRECSGDLARCLVSGGLVFFTGLLLAAGSTLVLTVVLRRPVGATFDAFAVCLLTASAVGRIGCFLAGCCYGGPTDLPWGVRFPPPGLMPPELHGLALHPAQLYLAAAFAGLAALLAWRSATRRFPGELALLGLAGYAAITVAVSFVRWGDAPSIVATLFWCAVAVAAVVILAAARRPALAT